MLGLGCTVTVSRTEASNLVSRRQIGLSGPRTGEMVIRNSKFDSHLGVRSFSHIASGTIMQNVPPLGVSAGPSCGIRAATHA